MRSIFLILICLYASLGYTQESKQVTSLIEKCKKAAQYPDSLKYYGEKLLEVAEQTNSDLAYAEGYFAIGYGYYIAGDFPNAARNYDSAALYTIDYRSHLRIQRNRAITYKHLGDYDQSKSVCFEMIEFANQQGDSTAAVQFYNQLGLISRNQGELEVAVQYFDKAIIFYQKAGNRYALGNVLVNIGTLYSQMGFKEKALENLFESLKIAKELKNDIMVARAYNNISVVYRELDTTDSATYYLRKSIDLGVKVGSGQLLPNNYNNLGAIYLKKKELDSAFKYFFLARKFNKLNNDPQVELEVFLSLGKAYLEVSEYEKALLYLDSSINLSRKIGITMPLSDTYKLMAKCQSALGDYKSSYQLLQYANLLADSTYKSEGLLAMSEITAKYNLEEKESVNRQLSSALNISNATISQQRTVITIVSVLLVLVICLAIFSVYQFRQSRSRAYQLEQKNQRIETLMRELHHRVKNNLQVISSLLGLQSMKLENETAQQAVEEGKERIRAMSLIHQKLYQQDEVTSLNIRDYVNNLVDELAQSYGYADKARINIEVPSVLLDADTTLPVGLIINELVSNAFKYAFKNIERPVLELKLIQQQESIMLSVKDNGEGLPEGFAFEKAKSFGLKLVHLLTKQLNGSMQVRNSPGVDFQLSFTLK
ncbi:MAG: histidine kinase dimerization/phosphoacceptor domain -containing protein [Cyclobacteriaceae bacterium]